MTYPTLPAETTYTDIERDLIENEPPGMFPEDQNSYWGQFRKITADYLQANALDLFTAWYNNLDPRNVDANDIAEWEERVGVPGDRTGLTLAVRRAFVQNRLASGAFGRALIGKIIEGFITATFGTSTSFGSGGIPFGSGGATLFSGVSGDPKTMYRVYFDYMNRIYYVRILNTLGEDLSGLTRELKRITPAGWTLNISDVVNPLLYQRMVIDDAPLVYLKLDGNGNDSSGYVNTATITGTPAGGASLINTAADGGAGSSYVFDGVDDRFSIPHVALFNQFARWWTLEAWVRLDVAPGAGATRTLFSKGIGPAHIQVDSSRRIFVAVGGGANVAQSSSVLTIGQAYHLAVRRKPGTRPDIFLNGVNVGVDSASPLADFADSGNAISFGANGASNYWNGILDEFAFYDSYLDDATILAHYNTGINVA